MKIFTLNKKNKNIKSGILQNNNFIKYIKFETFFIETDVLEKLTGLCNRIIFQDKKTEKMYVVNFDKFLNEKTIIDNKYFIAIKHLSYLDLSNNQSKENQMSETKIKNNKSTKAESFYQSIKSSNSEMKIDELKSLLSLSYRLAVKESKQK